MYIYVRDGYITRPVLKPSDGFKAGPTALNPAGRLDIRPNSFEAGEMADIVWMLTRFNCVTAY